MRVTFFGGFMFSIKTNMAVGLTSWLDNQSKAIMLNKEVPLLCGRRKPVDQLIVGVMHYEELNAHSLQIPSHRELGCSALSPSVHHGKHENSLLKLLPLC